jgi:predicted SAM-dependent methyltransferase
MFMSGFFYRIFYAPRSSEVPGNVNVHFGPGQRNYIQGWINVDANIFTGKADVWTDFDSIVPFNSSSIDNCYSHHVVEHLRDLDRHFSEIYRILKPGGYYRVAVPNADAAIEQYQAGDLAWFSDFPRSYSSIGGRLNNFILCANEHLHICTKSYLQELVTVAGFREMKWEIPKHTENPVFLSVLDYEWESYSDKPHTLVLELRK